MPAQKGQHKKAPCWHHNEKSKPQAGSAWRQKPAFTMPKEMTASEEYTRAQEQTSLERVFNNLDKKGDGKVHCSGSPCEPLQPPQYLAALPSAD